MTTPVCPFVKAARPDDACPAKKSIAAGSETVAARKDSGETANVSLKCPFGYDSSNFKLGPLSCMICHALLFDSTKCIPCSHLFCHVCVSRFKDCPLCGADIEKLEADTNLQSMVDRFIEGHARIKRPHVDVNEGEQVLNQDKKVIYEDVSLDRGAFLVQQAMRAFRAQNFKSAKSRLTMCAEDIRGQLEKSDNSSELCSQLGAVLGMLGDCCRAMGDSADAIHYFEESIEFLTKLPTDLEITHTLSVSLNKIGDLKYYDGDLQAARSYYLRSLGVRRDFIKNHPGVASQQILDVSVSLAKVADVDRTLGKEDEAVDGFQEAIKLLESLSLKSEEASLEPRRLSVLAFLKTQLEEKQSEATASLVST